MIEEFDISMLDMSDFPYHGCFFKYEVDENKPLDEQVEEEILVYETDNDTQKRSGIRQSNLFISEYTIYFPLKLNPNATGTVDKYLDCGVRKGHTYRGEFYGETIEGKVEFVRPSQLGGMSVDIKVVTENESYGE